MKSRIPSEGSRVVSITPATNGDATDLINNLDWRRRYCRSHWAFSVFSTPPFLRTLSEMSIPLTFGIDRDLNSFRQIKANLNIRIASPTRLNCASEHFMQGGDQTCLRRRVCACSCEPRVSGHATRNVVEQGTVGSTQHSDETGEIRDIRGRR